MSTPQSVPGRPPPRVRAPAGAGSSVLHAAIGAVLVGSLHCGSLTAIAHAPRDESGKVIQDLVRKGYKPNAELSGLLQPGNVIQTQELGEDGKPTPLSPPLVLAWGSDCFPGTEPREAPFAVESGAAHASRDFSLHGPDALWLLPTLNVDLQSVSDRKLTFQNPRVRAFARGDLSDQFSEKCVAALARALEDGDRQEWFSIVVESVVVDALRLEIDWAANASAGIREQLTAKAAQALGTAGQDVLPTVAATLPSATAPSLDPYASAAVPTQGSSSAVSPSQAMLPPTAPPGGGAHVKIAKSDATSSVIELAGTAVVMFRTRPIKLRPASGTPTEAPATAPASLRDFFQGGSADDGRMVGRIALQKMGNEPRRVRIDHPFHTADAFQLEVTSSRPGWMYVLHGRPGKQPKILWPRLDPATGAPVDRNDVRGQEPLLVPPSPASLRFDAEVGAELMYVVIRSTPEPPQLETVAAGALAPSAAPQPASAAPQVPKAATAKGKTTTLQIAVRGPSGKVLRTVVLDPGVQDADPSMYFAAPREDAGGDLILEFHLTHVG